MDKNEKKRRLNFLIKHDRDVRGGFLIQTTFIDHIIADIITAHFTTSFKKHDQLYSYVIMPKLNFKTKIDILEKILKKYYTHLYEKDLFALLKRIRKFRNRVAHAIIDNSEDFLKGDYKNRIGLVFYENGLKKTQIITKKEFIKRTTECSNALRRIQEIQKEFISLLS